MVRGGDNNKHSLFGLQITRSVDSDICLWPPCVADADLIILQLWLLSSFFLLSFFFFFPRLFSSVAKRMSTILPHTRCDFSANLECRSKMSCTRIAENRERKKSPKIRHLGTITQFCRAVSLQLRHVSTIGKKSLLNSSISNRRLQGRDLHTGATVHLWRATVHP